MAREPLDAEEQEDIRNIVRGIGEFLSVVTGGDVTSSQEERTAAADQFAETLVEFINLSD